MKARATLSQFKQLLVLCLVCTAFAGNAQVKEIKKQADLTPQDIVDIEIGHQDVRITTWDKPSMEVIVRIEVETDSEADKQKVYSLYDFEIRRSGGKVSVEIDFFTDKVKNMNSNNGVTRVTLKNGDKVTYRDLKAEIEIFTSKKHGLELEGRFSDISLGDMEAPVGIELSSSELKGNNASSLKLEAQFSEILFNSCGDADVELKSSELSLKKVGEFNLDGSFSEVEVDEVGRLRLEAQSGEIEIGTVGSIEGDCSFSQLSVGKLNGSLVLDAQSCTIEIDEVITSFERIDLDCDFSTVEIDLRSHSYDLEVNADFSSVETADGKVKSTNQHFNNIEYSGRVGKGASSSKVSIDCNSCSVELK